jgi:hypothetical protein
MLSRVGSGISDVELAKALASGDLNALDTCTRAMGPWPTRLPFGCSVIRVWPKMPCRKGGHVLVLARSLSGVNALAVTEEAGPNGTQAPTQQPQLVGSLG